jgi:hypothetical protein
VTLPILPGIAGAVAGWQHLHCDARLGHNLLIPLCREHVAWLLMTPPPARQHIYDWDPMAQSCAPLAARWAIMGIILSLKIRCVPDFSVLQKVERCKTFDEVLTLEKSYPLQEFVLNPYAWDFVAVRRRPIHKRPAAENSFKTRLYRSYMPWSCRMRLAHLMLKLFLSFQNPKAGAVRWLKTPSPWFVSCLASEIIDSNENTG